VVKLSKDIKRKHSYMNYKRKLLSKWLLRVENANLKSKEYLKIAETNDVGKVR